MFKRNSKPSTETLTALSRFALPRAVVLAGAQIIALLAPSAPAIAAPRTPPAARIVWSQFTDRNFSGTRIVSAMPDGRGVTALSHPGPGVYDLDPVWSPDHTQVAFERDLPDTSEVVIVNADGTGEHVLDIGCVAPCAGVNEPSWNADGSRLAFTPVIGPFDQPNESARQAVLWTARPDGSDLQRLSPLGHDGILEDGHARFSPDGSYLIFERGDNVTGQAAVFRMDANGANVRQLTPWNLEGDTADLSQATSGPTQDVVVFETYGHGAPPPGVIGDIATVPSTCPTVASCTASIQYVTHNGAGPRGSNNPAWAPDGSRIALVEYVAPSPAHNLKYADIYTVDPQGGTRHMVSTASTWNFRPDW